MNFSDPHALSFVVRWLHVVAMTFMVGGAGLLGAAALAKVSDGTALLKFSAAYEALFWLVLGVQVITGVGNLGSFGQALPSPEIAWGMLLVLKLSVVLLFVLFSLARSLLVVFLENAVGVTYRISLSRIVGILYVNTVIVLVGVLWLAEGLAHG